jgi:hypothetical protein
MEDVMSSLSAHKPRTGEQGVALALAVLAAAVGAYLVVSLVLAATTGIDLPLTNWPL